MKVVELEISQPDCCIHQESHKGKSCNVVKRGNSTRHSCYDLEFPFYLNYPKYSCHGKFFSILQKDVVNQIPEDIETNLQLLVMGETIVVNIQTVKILIFLDSKTGIAYCFFIL